MPRVKPNGQAGGLIDRPSRVGIFARRQRRLLRPALWSVVAVAGVAGVLHMSRLMRDEAAFAPLRSEIGHKVAMRIATITVSGRDMTTEAALQGALGVKVGDDMLGFSVEAARRRIDRLTFVEHATVERRLPGTIVVQLTERRPFAVWQNQGRFVLIDRSGALVADQGMNGKDADAFSQLPLVVGAGAPAAAEALIAALAAEPDVRAHVVAAVRVGQRRWNLTLRNGCDVLLPEGEEPAALHRLSQLQHSQQLLLRPLEAIDMRLPDRLVVRPRPVPPADPATADPADGDPGAVDPATGAPRTGASGNPAPVDGKPLSAKPGGREGSVVPATAGRTESGAAILDSGRRPA